MRYGLLPEKWHLIFGSGAQGSLVRVQPANQISMEVCAVAQCVHR